MTVPIARSAGRKDPWPARSSVNRTELNPVSFLDRSAAVHPGRVAVIDGDRHCTYAELHERVARLAGALRASGLERHDRVAAVCLNTPELLELHHAVPAAGGVLVAMAGYFADEEGTAKAFRGGWFHSGDLAVWHPDNAIELRDRGKDVIISGGENVSSIEVEQTICAHPAVLECAVVAIPHERWRERPKAFVTLKEGATATEAEIVAFCRDRIAHFKCPDAVAFGPLPKTSTGKVQ
jgi:acyl-CoA synthetase (AMP-forming)/AMP-acid ligase II